MVEMTEIQMAAKIQEVANELGLEATHTPAISDDPGLKRRFLKRWRPVVMRPDLVIEHEGRLVVVEVKRGQVLPGGVEQVLGYVDSLDAKGVICVPDAVFPNIAASVARYADSADIRICPISEVGDVLKHLLSIRDAEHGDR